MPKKATGIGSKTYKPGKEKYFWSYLSAMADLKISRRTLQRWLDDLNIDSLEFEDHLKVFLTLPQVKLLREYSKFMDTRNHSLIERFREYNSSGNTRRMAQLKRELKEYLTE